MIAAEVCLRRREVFDVVETGAMGVVNDSGGGRVWGSRVVVVLMLENGSGRNRQLCSVCILCLSQAPKLARAWVADLRCTVACPSDRTLQMQSVLSFDNLIASMSHMGRR